MIQGEKRAAMLARRKMEGEAESDQVRAELRITVQYKENIKTCITSI